MPSSQAVPGTVVFKRDEADDSYQMWEDKSLISAYERAVQSGQSDLARRKKKTDWQLGDWCRAVFEEDDVEYEATIESVDLKRGHALVRFVGYGNEQMVKLKDLRMSDGVDAREEQVAMAEEDEEFDEDEEEDDDEKEEVIERPKEWRVGDSCTAECTVDNLWYEAKIENISDGVATIRFIGYNNEQQTDLNDLYPSRGEKYAVKQFRKAQTDVELDQIIDNIDLSEVLDNLTIENGLPEEYEEKMEKTEKKTKKKKRKRDGDFACPPAALMIPPPPPPQGLSRATDSDGLNRLLLSWYMAGYEAGMYAATVNNKKSK